MWSKCEQVLAAVVARLGNGLTATVRRNEALTGRVPGERLVILRDGDPGEPCIKLNPLAIRQGGASDRAATRKGIASRRQRPGARGVDPSGLKRASAYPVGSASARCGVGCHRGRLRSWVGRISRAVCRSSKAGLRPTTPVGAISWRAAGRTASAALAAATAAAAAIRWSPAICCNAGRAGARPR